jgi:hypothetical protein
MGLPRAVADQLAAIPSKVVALQSAWTASVTPGNGEQRRQFACRLLPAVSWRDGARRWVLEIRWQLRDLERINAWMLG